MSAGWRNAQLPLVRFCGFVQVVFMVSSFQKGRGLVRGAAPGGLMRSAASNLVVRRSCYERNQDCPPLKFVLQRKRTQISIGDVKHGAQ